MTDETYRLVILGSGPAGLTAALYAARPDVMSVVHNHSPSVIPFSVTATKMRPIMHMCAPIGSDIPTWDIRDKFGDTNMLVTNVEQGRDLATTLERNNVVLMCGHGFAAVGRSLGEAVRIAVYLPKNARVYMEALRLGEVRVLSPGEVERKMVKDPNAPEIVRAWEYWAKRAGCAHLLDGAA